MNFNSKNIHEQLDIRIFTTINGRILIGELISVLDVGNELQNVFQIISLDPVGMEPIHPDSVMKPVSVLLYDNIIETESAVSEELSKKYIKECLKYMILNTESETFIKEDKKNNFSTYPKKTNKKNKGIDEEPGNDFLFNWRNKLN